MLEEVRVALLEVALVEVLAPALGLVIVTAQVEETPPKILEGGLSNVRAQRLLLWVLEMVLGANPHRVRLVSIQMAGKAAVLEVVLGLDY